MSKRFRIVSTAALGLAFGSYLAAQTPAAIVTPPVPVNLDVPQGNTLFLQAHARGTQNYICLPAAFGFAWTFFSPQATLSLNFQFPAGEFQQQVITHFLSRNPDENNTARVTWQNSQDTSAVWGRMHPNGSSTDPNFVTAGAIPWVLLDAVGTEPGPNGGDLLSKTTFIQRLNTQGGAAPATGCSTAGNVGATTLVPYTADYYFYKKSN
jgi:hypothetical protein